MKLIHPLLLLLLLIVIHPGYSQINNPFAPIGKKGKIMTAYGDRFIETFDNDSVQRIGSVLINIHTKKIVKILDSKVVYKKYADNSTSSRWMSVDPHAEKYANMSPYAAMGNNPILIIDPDGRDLIIRGAARLQDEYARMLTKTTGFNITINHESGKLSVGAAVEGALNTSKVLARLVSQKSADPTTFTYSLLAKDDEVTWIDSYKNGTVDIGDLQNIEQNTDNAFLAGVMGHWITEVTSNNNYDDPGSRNEASYDRGHRKGLKAEGKIVGEMLGIFNSARTTEIEDKTPENNVKKQVYTYHYGGGGDATADYLLGQGVKGVTIETVTETINGITVRAQRYNITHNGVLTIESKK